MTMTRGRRGLLTVHSFAGMYVLTALLHTALGLSPDPDWPGNCRSRWVLWPPTLGASTRSSTAALAVVLAVGLMLKPRPRPPPLSLSSPAAATAPTFLPAMLLLDAGGTAVNDHRR
jgi:hypothetical protein